MSCKVKNCRYNHTHITSGHKCGKCGLFGHGQIECGKQNLLQGLIKYQNDELNNLDWCNINNCFNHRLHKTIAHQCSKCNRFHSEDNCIIQPFDVLFNNYGFEDTLQNFDIESFEVYHETSTYQKSYVKIFLGQGCSAFIRNNNGEIMTIFMHCDSWGQYNYSTSDLPIFEKFIEGYIEVQPNINNEKENKNSIKCPICRSENSFDSIHHIKGSDTKCSICLEKNVELFFSKCGHACICNDCFKTLKKY